MANKLRKRWDGWISALTGIGTTAHDKRVSHDFISDIVEYELARELWRGDDIAARVIDLPADEMTRAGYEISVSDNRDAQTKIEKMWEELELFPKLLTALSYDSAYGGSAILIGARDFEELSKPLNIDRVKSVDFLTVLESRELVPQFYYNDPSSNKYGEPEIYQLTTFTNGLSLNEDNDKINNVFIHESRLLIFPGIKVSRQNIDGFWGDSRLTRLWRVLRDFNIAWDGTGVLVSDFSQAVFKMAGLAELIAKDQDNIFANRMRAMELGRSVARAVLIDESEEYERKQTPVAGLAEILREYQPRLASAAGMPITVLFGSSPSGLNSTGESDMRIWYDRIASEQNKKVTPKIKYLTRILMSSIGVRTEDWSVTPKPLWQPTDKEKAETRKIQTDSDIAYIQNGVLFPDEVAQSRFGGDKYSLETVVDFEEREALVFNEQDKETFTEAENPDSTGKDLQQNPKNSNKTNSEEA